MLPINFLSLEEALKERALIKERGESLVLTNGCFDLLHAGHIYSLSQAAGLGDKLWVALNSDKSISKIKGTMRPIINETERAYMLSSLKCINRVFLFDSPTLEYEISALKPEIYVKSSDYNLDTINEKEKLALTKEKTVIRFVDLLPGKSTTQMIDKIKSI